MFVLAHGFRVWGPQKLALVTFRSMKKKYITLSMWGGAGDKNSTTPETRKQRDKEIL